jgi:hypothetical protein
MVQALQFKPVIFKSYYICDLFPADLNHIRAEGTFHPRPKGYASANGLVYFGNYMVAPSLRQYNVPAHANFRLPGSWRGICQTTARIH